MKLLTRYTKDISWFNLSDSLEYRTSEHITLWVLEFKQTDWLSVILLPPPDTFFWYFGCYANLNSSLRRWFHKMTAKDQTNIEIIMQQSGIRREQIPWLGCSSPVCEHFLLPHSMFKEIEHYFQVQIAIFEERSVIIDSKQTGLESMMKQWDDLDIIINSIQILQEGKSNLKLSLYDILNSPYQYMFFIFLQARMGECSSSWGEFNEDNIEEMLLKPDQVSKKGVYSMVLVRLLKSPFFYNCAYALAKNLELIGRAPKISNHGSYDFREELFSYLKEMEAKYPFLSWKLPL